MKTVLRVVFSGPQGSGKTRLGQELALLAHGIGYYVTMSDGEEVIYLGHPRDDYHINIICEQTAVEPE